MIYELSFEGHTVGYFPTEAEAVRRAGYLPKGRYTIREWERDGDVLMFHPQTNREYEFTKLLQKREMRKDIVIELSYKGFSRASDYS